MFKFLIKSFILFLVSGPLGVEPNFIVVHSISLTMLNDWPLGVQ